MRRRLASILARRDASYPPSVATSRPRRRASASAGPSAGDDRRILHHALEEAARLLHADGAMVYLLDRESGILRFADDAGITDDRRRQWVRSLTLEPGVGLFGRAVEEGRIVETGDYANDGSFV